jgi:hypothetical protein
MLRTRSARCQPLLVRDPSLASGLLCRHRLEDAFCTAKFEAFQLTTGHEDTTAKRVNPPLSECSCREQQLRSNPLAGRGISSEMGFNDNRERDYNLFVILQVLVNTRTVLLIGVLTGLATSGAVLTLLWFGVSGVLYGRGIDLMLLFWPSSVMLVMSWRSTIPGVMITISSVAINCLLYMSVAYCILRLVRLFRGSWRSVASQ